MQKNFKAISTAALVALLGATASASTVTVQPSSIGFKAALAACPSGTLAAISLTLGHVRISEAPGVDSDIDDANPSAQTITLSGAGKSASVAVNAHANGVTAKHVTLVSGKRVACVAPD